MRAASVATDETEFCFTGSDAPLFTRRLDGVATIVLPRYVALALKPSIDKGSPVYIGAWQFTVKSCSVSKETGEHSYVLSPLVDKL